MLYNHFRFLYDVEIQGVFYLAQGFKRKVLPATKHLGNILLAAPHALRKLLLGQSKFFHTVKIFMAIIWEYLNHYLCA